MTPIHVTRTFLPELSQVKSDLEAIWLRGQVTNNGPLVRKLEDELSARLGASSCLAVANGTLALQLMLRKFKVKGKVITSPFSYVATASAVLWEHCTPVFADVDNNGNLDPHSAAQLMDEDVQAILATHVYGIPCQVEALEQLAQANEVPLLYDAAHGFGVRLKGKSLFDYGDASICSFHSTKLFHSIEGGGIFFPKTQDRSPWELLRAFGHKGDQHVQLGINAKMSELHAMVGLQMLEHVDALIAERKDIFDRYKSLGIKGLRMWQTDLDSTLDWNYGYVPVLMENEACLQRFMEHLAASNIFPRRYFYPALNQLPYIQKKYNCPQAEDLASRALCLPIFNGMSAKEWERIEKALTSFDG